jgi:sigma-B regulation protein RsbQ
MNCLRSKPSGAGQGVRPLQRWDLECVLRHVTIRAVQALWPCARGGMTCQPSGILQEDTIIAQHSYALRETALHPHIIQRNNVKVHGSDGPVLLYAHGFGCNQNMWHRITPAFAATHRQVLFDYVGSGQSDLSAFDSQRYARLDGYAQDVLDVCDALDLHSGVTFVGHSVSSSIGLLAAIARPQLFDRLVLLGPSPCFLNHPPDYLGGFEPEDLEDLLSLMDQNYMGWANYLAPVVAGSSGAEVAGELSNSFCSTDPLVAKVFARATFFADNRADLAQVACPSLILQHRHDALAPLGVGQYLADHLAHSVLQVLDVSGHCAHMSNPAEVIDAMQRYFAGPATPQAVSAC